MQRRAGFTLHAAFAIALAAILALKWYLYFGSPVTGTGITPSRVGSSLSHLLLWTATYHFCRFGRDRAILATMAFFALFFGVLTAPLIGWLIVVAMYVIYRNGREPAQELDASLPAAPAG